MYHTTVGSPESHSLLSIDTASRAVLIARAYIVEMHSATLPILTPFAFCALHFDTSLLHSSYRHGVMQSMEFLSATIDTALLYASCHMQGVNAFMLGYDSLFIECTKTHCIRLLTKLLQNEMSEVQSTFSGRLKYIG